ncbi:hypothetical protein Esti_002377 [Eimeria stiedai]
MLPIHGGERTMRGPPGGPLLSSAASAVEDWDVEHDEVFGDAGSFPEAEGAPLASHLNKKGAPLGAPGSAERQGGTPATQGPLQRRRKPNTLGLTRDTRYTMEQVLDPRTLRYIQVVARAGNVKKLFGIISCGKESNVYFALAEKVQQQQQRQQQEQQQDRKEEELRLKEQQQEQQHELRQREQQQQQQQQEHQEEQQQQQEELVVPLALKVYRTSILSYKDRSRYVQGDFRFNHAYSRNRNPRKMMAVWAAKEQRNLLRLHAAGIDCPRPVALKGNVLLMQFVGSCSYKQKQQQHSPLQAQQQAMPQQQQQEEEMPQKELDDGGSVCSETDEETEEETDGEAASKGGSLSSLSLTSDLWGEGNFSAFAFEPKWLSYEAAPRLKDLKQIAHAFEEEAERSCLCLCSRCAWRRSRADQVAAGWRFLYTRAVLLLRQLFQRCRFVHGDFSDYNLLYFRGRLVVIDVSQAVERDHPQALDFLKRDCKNAAAFFSKRIQVLNNATAVSRVLSSSLARSSSSSCCLSSSTGECYCESDCESSRDQWTTFPPRLKSDSPFFTAFPLLTVRELFEFVVAAELPEPLKRYMQKQQQQQKQRHAGEACADEAFLEAMGHYLAGSLGSPATAERGKNEAAASSSSSNSSTSSSTSSSSEAEQEVGDAVFLNSWIPSSLHDFSDISALDRWAAGTARPSDEALLNLHKLVNERAPNSSSSSSGSSGGERSEEEEEEGGGARREASRRRRRRVKSEEGEQERFDGIIPEGVSRKDWKKQVKELNRERRQHKIPKHLKKKFRKKAANR